MITQIELNNFKAFRSLSLPLSPMTLLAGTNSSGKSTVLQALGLLHQSLQPAAAESWSLQLNGEFAQFGTATDLRHEQWDKSVTELEGSVGVAVAIDGRRYSFEGAYEYDADVIPLSPTSSSLSSLAESPLGNHGFQYIRADRMPPATVYERSFSAIADHGSFGARGQHAVNFLRVHQDDQIVAAKLSASSETSPGLLRQTEAWLSEICPGVNLDLKALEGTDSVLLAFRFGRSGLESTNAYRPTNVGFGLAYVLPIVVAALTSDARCLLLVENPEAHLHPAGQMAMGRLLAAASSNGAQVLVETHSDHVLNAVRIAVKTQVLDASAVRLHYFSREEKGEPQVTSPVIGRAGDLSEWPAGFFDEWEKALLRLTAE